MTTKPYRLHFLLCCLTCDNLRFMLDALNVRDKALTAPKGKLSQCNVTLLYLCRKFSPAKYYSPCSRKSFPNACSSRGGFPSEVVTVLLLRSVTALLSFLGVEQFCCGHLQAEQVQDLYRASYGHRFSGWRFSGWGFLGSQLLTLGQEQRFPGFCAQRLVTSQVQSWLGAGYVS